MSDDRKDPLLKVKDELSLILTHAGEGIYGLDLNGKTTFVNSAAARMVGLELKHLKGKCNHSLVHYKHLDGSHYPKTQCPIYATLQDGKARQGDDEYFIRSDGSPFPIQYSVNPIIVNGRLTGAVVTFTDITERKEKEALLFQYQNRLEELVEEKTKALSLANYELKKISFTDALTGIANRRSFDTVLNRELKRAQRLNKPLTLIIGDVDHFKRYNDGYGHNAGDECLRLIGHELQKTFKRAGDFVARYGGEEFAIILIDISVEHVKKKASQLLKNIQNLKIVHDSSPTSHYVSMSLGIAHQIPSNITNAAFVELADNALYQAKKGGRNKYVFAELNKCDYKD